MRLSSIIVLIITLFILIRCSQAVNDTTDEQTCRFNLNTILGTTANGINSTTECTEVRALVTLPTYYTNQPTLSPPLLTPSFSLHSLILSFLPHAVLGDFYWAGVLQAGSHQFCCDSTQHNRGGNIAAVSSLTIPLPLPLPITPLSPLSCMQYFLQVWKAGSKSWEGHIRYSQEHPGPHLHTVRPMVGDLHHRQTQWHRCIYLFSFLLSGWASCSVPCCQW